MPELADDMPALVASYSEAESVPATNADLIFPDEQDDTGALLVMMGFASVDAAETGEITPSAESNEPGEVFWQCLVTGCRSGCLINITVSGINIGINTTPINWRTIGRQPIITRQIDGSMQGTVKIVIIVT
ncbi:hypothetical protein [Salmonella enterica]|uniref:hypothetical protein n=1 Tax=Salmonella enterica TaxID=28901 RepID=UPI0020C4CBD4|nr:hypothetical protein [Salmonella enterica]